MDELNLSPIIQNALKEHAKMIDQMILYAEKRRIESNKYLAINSLKLMDLRTSNEPKKLELQEPDTTVIRTDYKRLPWDPELNFICD